VDGQQEVRLAGNPSLARTSSRPSRSGERTKYWLNLETAWR
jgi:hypothetical protein